MCSTGDLQCRVPVQTIKELPTVRRWFDIPSFAAAAQKRCSMDEHLLGLSRETLTCSELFVCSACILVMNALRPSRLLVLGLFSLGMCPHNGKAGAFSCGTTRTHVCARLSSLAHLLPVSLSLSLIHI